jgi:hypothetical protein
MKDAVVLLSDKISRLFSEVFVSSVTSNNGCHDTVVYCD